MKNISKNCKKAVIYVLICGALVVLSLFANRMFGNPISKSDAEKNIKSYIIDTYRVTDFSIEDFGYSREFGGYGGYVMFDDSEDSYFYIRYNPKTRQFYDTYDELVASGFNTYARLNRQYWLTVGTTITLAYPEASTTGDGMLGKYVKEEEHKNWLVPDMEFDMANLPLEATVSVFFSRQDTSAQQFATDLIDLQKLMYKNLIAVDYFDVMYNNTILLEDFPAVLVTENLDSPDILAQLVEKYLNK